MTSMSTYIETIDKIIKKVLFGICACLSIYYLYTGFFGTVSPMWQMIPLLSIGILLALANYPLSKKNPFGWPRLIDYALIILSIIACLYLRNEVERSLVVLGTTPSGWRLFFAWAIIILTLETTRRVMGLPLPIIAIIFIIYGRWGDYMPGLLTSRGYFWDYLADFIALGFDGIFGKPLTVCGNVVVYFLIFAAFLKFTGATDFFSEAAAAIFGRYKGGPAKMAVVASSLFGTLSGSGVANVVTTGTFTIPLMKKLGFSSVKAGAVESLASTGGQFMPPIMGAAAFLMADMLGIPYWSVVVAAFLPAALYYLSLFLVVHFEASKGGMKGLPKDELPPIGKALSKSWSVIVPLAVLVYELGVARVSAHRSVLIALVVLVGISFLTKETRLTPKKFIDAMEEGIRAMTVVTLACACAGIVIGVIYLTNVGLALTGMLVEVSGGSMLVLLFLASIASLILGMGVTTSACYLIVAILVAPALVKMGALPMTAHLFVFYFGCLSMITPPVALASYAAAGVSNCNPMACGWTAMRLGFIAYIIPFMWIYQPALVLHGDTITILLGIVTAVLGVVGFASMIQGYLFVRTNLVQRLLLGAGGLVLLYPGWRSDLMGLALMAVPVIWQLVVYFREAGHKHPQVVT